MKNLIALFWFSIGSIATAQSSYSQERNIIVIIDTIVNRPERFFITSTQDSLEPVREWIFSTVNEMSSSAYIFPNIVAEIRMNYLMRNVIIPIDNDGGKLLLLNVYNLPTDTLRIRKLFCLSNCLPIHSVYSAHHWKINKKGDLIKPPYKNVYRKDTIPADCNEKAPETITCTINGRVYTSLLSIASDMHGVERVGHGYFPTQYRKKNGDYKRNAKYFHFRHTKTNDTYFAMINLE